MSAPEVKRNGYKVRKAARLRGEPMKSRAHEPAPWYTFRIGGNANVNEDGRVRLEREMREHAERADKRRRERAERSALHEMLVSEGYVSSFKVSLAA